MESLDNSNVFVKHLPQEMGDAKLRQLFAPFGSIISARVMLDVESGSSLGYGYISLYMCIKILIVVAL